MVWIFSSLITSRSCVSFLIFIAFFGISPSMKCPISFYPCLVMCLWIYYLVSHRHEAKGFNAGYCTTYFLGVFCRLRVRWGAQSCLTLWDPMDSVTWNSQTEYWRWVQTIVFSGGSWNPEIKSMSPKLRADSLWLSHRSQVWGQGDLYVLINLCLCIKYLSTDWKKKNTVASFYYIKGKC